ncbi:macrolide phosphotransferase [Nakamurella panacisegetis]|uniref:Macrolide phosphotransferase n=1 Tax=Nakamurella panacisegetis TaxID=1090615 RepID=A0A1H0KAZ4_9ACTN|nr:phosphotransferase [Nakamurella panacisegetis]SDO53094.1 macrolide phosphotransferase [Nakamurella panacisegetis]
MTPTVRPWTDLARRAAPQLRLRGVEVIETGWDSRILRAVAASGERWIFRFPRRAEVLPDLARERTLLDLLGGALPVAVPDWQVHARVGPQLVIGYPELPGFPAAEEPLGDGDFDFRIALPPPAVYAGSLGRTLAVLHRLTPPGLPAATAGDLRTVTDRLLRRSADLPVPAVLSAYWQSWIDDDTLWAFEPRLTHGDVHPGHTMIDDAGALVGLIDWTDSGWDDPASDFVDPRHAFGPAFGADLLAAYARAGGVTAGVSDRVIRRQSFGALHAARFGVDHARPELTRRALERMTGQAAHLECGRSPV